MIKKRFPIGLIFILAYVTLPQLPCAAQSSRESQVKAFVSILPQAYFLTRIGGSRVKVDVLVQPGQSPETYTVTPQQITAISAADLYFCVGVPFEDSVIPKFRQINTKLKVIDTRRDIHLRNMDNHDMHTADHEHHGGQDPHIWLSPRLVMLQAMTMFEALVEIDPAGVAEYTVNLKQFTSDLIDLHSYLKQRLSQVRGKTFMVYHPSFGYFADAYGLRQQAIEMEGKEPSPRNIMQFISEAKSSGIKVIFTQKQFSQQQAETIANAIGGKVMGIDPLAQDYLENLKQIGDVLADNL